MRGFPDVILGETEIKGEVMLSDDCEARMMNESKITNLFS